MENSPRSEVRAHSLVHHASSSIEMAKKYQNITQKKGPEPHTHKQIKAEIQLLHDVSSLCGPPKNRHAPPRECACCLSVNIDMCTCHMGANFFHDRHGGSGKRTYLDIFPGVETPELQLNDPSSVIDCRPCARVTKSHKNGPYTHILSTPSTSTRKHLPRCCKPTYTAVQQSFDCCD